MIARLANLQGAIGLAACVALLLLLVVQKGETRHWRKQSHGFERLYRAEQRAHLETVANYRSAAEAARRADAANRERVLAAQRQISERTVNDYEARLASARARADRVRRETATAAAAGGGSRAAAMPASRGAASRAAGAAAKDEFSVADRLIATEQAIQLEALIGWVKAQSAVDTDSTAEPAGR